MDTSTTASLPSSSCDPFLAVGCGGGVLCFSPTVVEFVGSVCDHHRWSRFLNVWCWFFAEHQLSAEMPRESWLVVESIGKIDDYQRWTSATVRVWLVEAKDGRIHKRSVAANT